MRVYLDTNGDIVTSPASRMWFYQMRDNLVARGIDADLNHLGKQPYDVAIIHWSRPDAIYRLREHSPNAHVGILNPGGLALEAHYAGNKPSKPTSIDLYTLDNIDFFIVTGFPWRDLLLPYKKRVYLTIDYDTSTGKQIKHHTATEGLVIGYHGNPFHFKEDFFPNGAKALKRLADEFNFILQIVTNSAAGQPSIEGIHTKYIEFDLETFGDEIQKFDIGICPVISDTSQLANRFKYIRNPNRVNTLLFYGIPSVTSPVPQSCQDLRNGETALFAVTEEGWYQALRLLVTQPELRNRIGRAGREMVEKCFSTKCATDLFIEMLQEEVRQPLYLKRGGPPPTMNSNAFSIQNHVRKFHKSLSRRIKR